MSLADVMQPAIKHASRGYAATPYLHECITDSAADMLQGQGDLGDLSAEGRAAEGRRARGAIGICGDADVHFAAWRSGAVSRTARRHPRRLHESAWRLHHPRGSHQLQDDRAPADPRRLSRLANSGAAAARGLRRAHRADAQHSRRLRYRRTRFRLCGNDPLPRRSAEDRLRRPRGGERRSGFCQRAGGAADFEGLCRGAPPRDRSRPCAVMERRRRAARRRAHHAYDGGGCVWQRGRDHADHQQSVRRQDHDPRPRHRAEQLHEPLRSPAGPCAVAGAGQARHHLDVADDGAARRQTGLCARPARRKADLSERDAGADQSDRPRHEPAGSGRGAAGLDRGQCARSGVGGAGKRARQTRSDGPQGTGGADGRRRHERNPVPRGRPDVGRGLLARRRHADRHGRRARARAGSCRFWAGR